MTLLSDIRNFFVRERGWGILFLLVLAVYALVLVSRERVPEPPPSEALEKLRQAEIKLKDQIRETGNVQQLLAGKPELALALSLLSLFLLGGVILGLVIDFLWMLQPKRRKSLGGAYGPPQARTWSVGTLFKAVLLFMVTSLALSAFLSFLRAFFFPKASSNLVILIHTTVSDLFCIGLVIYLIHRLGGSWRDLGFRGIRILKDLWVGLAGYAAVLPIFLFVLIALVIGAQILSYEPPPHPLVEIFLEEEERSPLLIGYSLFLACVAGPFFEEIFFRGFCYPAFKKRWGVGWALILSAAFFGLIHQNPFAFLPIFVLGLILGYLYEKRGTLVPSIVLHVIHNSVFITYFFLAKEALTISS